MDNDKGSTNSILIIDDDQSQLITLSDILEDEGFNPVCCKTGKEALNVVSSKEIQVAILDLRLPDYDGLVLLRELKKINPELKAIINTAYATLDSAMMAVNQEAFGFVKKMGDVRDLLSHIHRAFHAHLDLYSKTLESKVKKRTEELIKSEAKWRSISEYSPNYIFLLDLEGRILFANKDFYNIDKYGIVGKSIYDVLPHSAGDTAKNCYSEVIKSGELGLYEIEYRDSSEKIHYVEFRVGPVLEGDKIIGLVNSATDITAPKLAELERRSLEAQLIQSHKMEALGTLAGGIAHDFNNILAVIIGYSELLLESKEFSERDQNNLNAIFNAGLRAKGLVEQILTFSRQKEQEMSPVNCQLIVKETMKFLRASIPSTIKIEQKIDPSSPLVLADHSQIHQIIMNLCTNAYHAIGENNGVISISLGKERVKEKNKYNLAEGIYLRLVVNDSGKGMEPQIIERIFDPFFTTKAVGKGTGLGLSVVHGAVHRLNGKIFVESEKSSGSTFTVFIPAMDINIKRDDNISAEIPLGTEKILLVDDDILVSDMVEQMLFSLGYNIVARNDSLQALDVFKENPFYFDLIISDQVMPNLTGLNMAKEILTIRPDVPVIIMSGFSEKISEEKIYDMGIKGYIVKPIIKKDIAQLIRRVLETTIPELKNKP
jgi:PAS domain S-box-containing protein